MTDTLIAWCIVWAVVAWSTFQSFKKYRAASIRTDGFVLQFARWFLWPEISGPDRAFEIKQLARGTCGFIPIIAFVVVYGTDIVFDIEAYDYELIGALLATATIAICIMVVRHDQIILLGALAWFAFGLYFLIRSPLQIRTDSMITVLLGGLFGVHQSAVILRAWMWYRSHSKTNLADPIP